MLKLNGVVTWKWLGREIVGVVREIHHQKITRTIKGKKITRNGSVENPAFVVESEAGNFALKLGSELSPQKKIKKSKILPGMFSD